MSSALDAEGEYERVVESLHGVRLAGVTYYPLTCGEDGIEAEAWDFGAWHQPTMGVQSGRRTGASGSAPTTSWLSSLALSPT